MGDPFRLRVLKAVSKSIKNINVPGGYCHDLGDYADSTGRPVRRVCRGRDQYGDNDPLPMVSIIENPNPVGATNANAGHSASTGDYKLLIMGVVENDRDHPTDPAHFLAADIVVALAKAKVDDSDILGLGSKMPCVTRMHIGQPVVLPSDSIISDVAFCYVELTLTLVEDLEKPYA